MICERKQSWVHVDGRRNITRVMQRWLLPSDTNCSSGASSARSRIAALFAWSCFCRAHSASCGRRPGLLTASELYSGEKKERDERFVMRAELMRFEEFCACDSRKKKKTDRSDLPGGMSDEILQSITWTRHSLDTNNHLVLVPLSLDRHGELSNHSNEYGFRFVSAAAWPVRLNW